MTSRDQYVPGNVGAFRSVAVGVRNLGQEFGDSSRELSSVQSTSQSSGWIGSAADQFHVTLEDLPFDLNQMSQAYDRVANALNTYAQTLERLQQSTDQAIERLNIKEAERSNADAQSDAARNRIVSLTAQLGVAQGVEKAAWLNYQRAKLDPIPGNEAGPYNSYLSARAKVGNLSQQRGNEQNSKNHWDQVEHDANQACKSLHDQLNSFKDARRQAERVCASAIRDALPAYLKNPSNFEKAANWVGDKMHDLGEGLKKTFDGLIDGVTKGDWNKFIDGIHDLAGTLADICDVLSIVVLIGAVVAAVAVTVFTGGAAFPLALGILKGGFMLSNAIGKVGTIARGVSFSTGVYLASTSAVVDGRRAVTWGEVASDGVQFGAGLAINRYTKGLDGGLDSGLRHLGLAQRGFVNFSKVAGNLGHPGAGMLFMDNFNKTVIIPHLNKALPEMNKYVIGTGVGAGVGVVGEDGIAPVVDGMAGQRPNELMLEEDGVKSINVDEIVDEAMEGSR